MLGILCIRDCNLGICELNRTICSGVTTTEKRPRYFHNLDLDLPSPSPFHFPLPLKGGATVLKVGGGQFCERSKQKKIFDPPLFGQWGDKILLR